MLHLIKKDLNQLLSWFKDNINKHLSKSRKIMQDEEEGLSKEIETLKTIKQKLSEQVSQHIEHLRRKPHQQM